MNVDKSPTSLTHMLHIWEQSHASQAKQECVFLNVRHFSRLPRFRLLVKSHKSLDLTPEGRWASRPLVGLANWATSLVSVLMATAGQIVLKLDSRDDPLSAPLRDTMDLLSRVRSQVEKLGTAHQLVLTNYDFNALYTRISWRWKINDKKSHS